MGYNVNEDGSVTRHGVSSVFQKCIKCGATNIPREAKFCPYCGNKLTLSSPNTEKTTQIVFIKDELSRINAYDSGLKCLFLELNGETVAYTEMRPYCQKEISVKKGDVIKLIGVSADYGWHNTKFELTVTDQILTKSKYYLEFIKKMWVIGEVDFHSA